MPCSSCLCAAFCKDHKKYAHKKNFRILGPFFSEDNDKDLQSSKHQENYNEHFFFFFFFFFFAFGVQDIKRDQWLCRGRLVHCFCLNSNSKSKCAVATEFRKHKGLPKPNFQPSQKQWRSQCCRHSVRGTNFPNCYPYNCGYDGEHHWINDHVFMYCLI